MGPNQLIGVLPTGLSCWLIRKDPTVGLLCIFQDGPVSGSDAHSCAVSRPQMCWAPNLCNHQTTLSIDEASKVFHRHIPGCATASNRLSTPWDHRSPPPVEQFKARV